MRVWDVEDGSKDSFTDCDWGNEWLVGRGKDGLGIISFA